MLIPFFSTSISQSPLAMPTSTLNSVSRPHVDVDNCFWFKPTGEFVNPPAGPPTFTADHFQPFALDGTYVPVSGLGLSKTDLLL